MFSHLVRTFSSVNSFVDFPGLYCSPQVKLRVKPELRLRLKIEIEARILILGWWSLLVQAGHSFCSFDCPIYVNKFLERFPQ